MHEIFSSILAVEEESLNKEMSVPEMLELVSAVNSILQVTFYFYNVSFVSIACRVC